MKMTGNTILITGGTSGIGLGFAERFLRLGNRVIICGRRKERLADIKARNPQMETFICDMTEEKQRETLRDWAVARFPDLNVCMNNAGIQHKTDLTRPVDLKNVHLEIETNLVAPIHLTSLFAAHLTGRPVAAVINISSGLAFVPLANRALYCATKAAIHSLTLSMRRQFRDTSVRVFEIIPPAVDTELGRQYWSDESRSHGGMAVAAFIDESVLAIESDTYEAAISMSRGLREKRETLFDQMNP
jgi:uncharacterized oxidoreductase